MPVKVIFRCSNPLCDARKELKKCAACRGVHYCSVECQREHWAEHKEHCKRLANDRANGYKSNSRKIVKHSDRGKIIDLLGIAYRNIKDTDASRQVLVSDQHSVRVMSREDITPEEWNTLIIGIEGRVENLLPCKRIIFDDGRRFIACVCPNFGTACPAPIELRKLARYHS